MFVIAMSFFSSNSLKYGTMNNQECKIRPETTNINCNEPSFYPWSVKISSGSSNKINDPHAKLCIPDVSKIMVGWKVNLWKRNMW